MNSKILTGKEYKDKVLIGVNKAAEVLNIVHGRNSKSLHLSGGITDDGVTVSQEVFSRDPFEDIGCGIIRSATRMVEKKIKNGTTTTGVMTAELLKELNSLPDEINILEVKSGLTKVFNAALKFAESRKSTIEDIYGVALDSCRNEDMAKFAIKLFKERDEYYEVDNKFHDTYGIEYEENQRSFGFKLLFNKGKSKIDNPYVISYDGVITQQVFLDNLFDKVKDKDAVIVARDVDPRTRDIIRAYISRHKKDIMFFYTIVKANHENAEFNLLNKIYNRRTTMLYNNLMPINIFNNIKSVSKDGTLVCEVDIKNDNIKQDVMALQKQIDDEFDSFQIYNIHKLINANLGRTFRVKLKSNEYNFNWQRDKLLDTINDLKVLKNSNFEVVDGGGVIFKDIANFIKNIEGLVGDEEKAIKPFANALMKPFSNILKNSYESDDTRYKNVGIGYNAINGEIGNMTEQNVVTAYRAFVAILQTMYDLGIEWLTTDGAIFVTEDEK